MCVHYIGVSTVGRLQNLYPFCLVFQGIFGHNIFGHDIFGHNIAHRLLYLKLLMRITIIARHDMSYSVLFCIIACHNMSYPVRYDNILCNILLRLYLLLLWYI